MDTLNVEIKFDRPFTGLQQAETAAEVFEAQLRQELTRPAHQWGYGHALVESVIVRTAEPSEVTS